jgi:flagellar basal-body rod protein FlgB
MPAPSLFAGVNRLNGTLDYHLERQNVLVSNIAHVDTPGYVPKDLARVDNLTAGSASQQFNVTMARTMTSHLDDPVAPGLFRGRVFEDPAASPGNDGNYVSLDREAAKIASNQVRYEVVAQLVASELDGLRFAANDGKG